MVDYVLEGPKWGDPAIGADGGTVTWSFASTVGQFFDFDYSIGDSDFQRAIRDAFGAWESVVNLDFVEVADAGIGSNDIRLGWDAIDGQYGVLGRAQFNYYVDSAGLGTFGSADVSFDTAEDWSTENDAYRAENVFVVALHEIGHAIGLGHSSDPDSIMYATTKSGGPTDLTADDIAGGQYLYGAASGTPETGLITAQHLTGTNAGERIAGGSGNDEIHAGAGNDELYGGTGSNLLDGGAGFDTAVYAGDRSAFFIELAGGSIHVTSADGSIDDQVNAVERLNFSDGTLAFDDNAAEAYRIYQAAFDRTPDTAGVHYWTDAIDDGVSLHDVAQGFVGSAEFKGLYGTNPSDSDYVEHLYENVLDRPGEAAGNDYWVQQIDDGLSRADVLAAFSESPENQANVIGTIDDGIWLG